MAPPHLQNVNPAQVGKLLSACLIEGCRAATMARSSKGRELIDLLVPAHFFAHLSEVDRAQATQQLLIDACVTWGFPRGDAGQIVIGLKDGMYGRSLTERREKAGMLMDTSGDGFRRRQEKSVLGDIAFEAIRLAADLPFTEPQLRLHLVG